MTYKISPSFSDNLPKQVIKFLDNGLSITINLEVESDLRDEYLAWLSEGNTPLPPDPIPEPEPLTPQQKLEASGLTVEELKELLGL